MVGGRNRLGFDGVHSLRLGRVGDAPVKDIVVLVSFTDHDVGEELAKVGIVGLIIEAEAAGVVDEDVELEREAVAEKLGRGRHLLFHDTIVLLLLGGGSQTLPGQRASEEVHEDVAQCLQIVTSGLL